MTAATAPGAVNSGVILSLLGFGVRDRPSRGPMIHPAARRVLAIDCYGVIGAATAFMFLLVPASKVFVDSLQGALDPKAHQPGTRGQRALGPGLPHDRS